MMQNFILPTSLEWDEKENGDDPFPRVLQLAQTHTGWKSQQEDLNS